ncbi:MAG: site-specific integrase, partial [Boseongicola sp. SB0673_bin_14]|nr:site-specific integrase [Boseongicola sp. SB0673_bin_14]
YKETPRERFLTAEEYRRLGNVLDEAEAEGSVFPSAIPAIRLLLLTGCRKSEILTLKWDDVDRTAGEIRLTDGKTGWRSVPLTPAAEHVLASIPRIEGNPWVITGQKRGARLKNLDAIWLRLRKRAGLDDVRIHDCRHSYASRALALGEGLSMIAALLGHRKLTTTARYAHLARDTEKASAAKVGGSIGADILPREDAA